MAAGIVFAETKTRLSSSISSILQPFLSNSECELSQKLKNEVKLDVTIKMSDIYLYGEFVEVIRANEIIHTFIETLKAKIDCFYSTSSKTAATLNEKQECLLGNVLEQRNLKQIEAVKQSARGEPINPTLNAHSADTEYTAETQSKVLTIDPHYPTCNNKIANENNCVNSTAGHDHILKNEATCNTIVKQDGDDQLEKSVKFINKEKTLPVIPVEKNEDECSKIEVHVANDENLHNNEKSGTVTISEKHNKTEYNLRKVKSPSWKKTLLNTDDDELDCDADSEDEYKPNKSDNEDIESDHESGLSNEMSEESIEKEEENPCNDPTSFLDQKVCFNTKNDKKSKKQNAPKVLDMHHEDVDLNEDTKSEEYEEPVYGYKKQIGKITKDVNDPSMAKAECKECSYVNTSKYPIPRTRLQNHYRRCHVKRELTLECEICGKKFGSQSELTDHNRKRHQYKKCEHCGIVIKRSSVYSHSRKHIEGYVINKHECKQCGKKYPTNFHLKQHIETAHVEYGKRETFPCEICHKVLSTKHSLKGHIKHVHGNKDKNHTCTQCGKGFPTGSALKNHQHAHDAIPQFVCHLCNKAFRYKSGVKIHLQQMHSNERNHLCSYCGKSFTQAAALVRHIRVHTGERPFACRVCGESFSDTSVRRRHMILKHKQQATKKRIATKQ